MERERFLRDREPRVFRGEAPRRNHRAGVGVAVPRREENLRGRPDECVAGELAGQRDGKRLADLRDSLLRGPDGEVAHRVFRVAPARKLDVDLVGAVCAYFWRGVVEHPEHDLWYEPIRATDEVEGVRPEAQPLPRLKLRARPQPVPLDDFQPEVAACIEPDVALVPAVRPWPALARSPDVPAASLPRKFHADHSTRASVAVAHAPAEVLRQKRIDAFREGSAALGERTGRVDRRQAGGIASMENDLFDAREPRREDLKRNHQRPVAAVRATSPEPRMDRDGMVFGNKFRGGKASECRDENVLQLGAGILAKTARRRFDGQNVRDRRRRQNVRRALDRSDLGAGEGVAVDTARVDRAPPLDALNQHGRR